MKKITTTKFLLLILLFIQLMNNYCFAQVNKENKYKWGIGVAINSFNGQLATDYEAMWGNVNINLINNSYGEKKDKSISMSLIPKYSINDDVRLRLELGTTKLNIAYNFLFSDTNIRQITSQNVNQNIYTATPGIEWSFFSKKFIKSYVGVTASYVSFGTLKYDYDFTVYRVPQDTLLLWQTSQTTVTGGFSAGFGLVAGFDFTICKFLSFGAEISSDLMYYDIGGKYEEVTIDYFPQFQSTDGKITNNRFNAIKFTRIQSSFNLTIWF